MLIARKSEDSVIAKLTVESYANRRKLDSSIYLIYNEEDLITTEYDKKSS